MSFCLRIAFVFLSKNYLNLNTSEHHLHVCNSLTSKPSVRKFRCSDFFENLIWGINIRVLLCFYVI